MKSSLTFWQLLDCHHITIPIIQRDYAQGRCTDKIESIRRAFIAALYETTEDESKTISLDFVYGKVNSLNELILLDGQQRMTTLYLFHWFVLLANNGFSSNDKDSSLKFNLAQLQKFSYHTRTSAREFCSQITSLEKFESLSRSVSFSDNCKNGKAISDEIKNQPWFHSIWLLDPTVQSMLVMLDEIHHQYPINGAVDFWEKLISSDKPPIVFEFLNMEAFNLTDELYVRMNARGKPLTQFENFKAWLFQQPELDISNEFRVAIDGDWADTFWTYNQGNHNDVDKNLMRFFNMVTLVKLVISLDLNDPSKSDGKKLIKSSDVSYKFGFLSKESDFIPFDVYSILDHSDIKQAEAFLNWLSEIDGNAFLADLNGENRPLKSSFFNGADIGFLEIAEFSALYMLVSQIGEEGVTESNIQDWLRVSRNIIRNTIIDSDLDLVKAIKSLSAILTHTEGRFSLERLRSLEVGTISFLRNEQLVEEVLKAELITLNSEWKGMVIETENHPYFFYQIGFLLEMSRDHSGEPNLNAFKQYSEIARALFDKEVVNDKNSFLLQRALLSFGDYFISKGKNRSFCKYLTTSARYRYENWRVIFNSYRDASDNTKYKRFRQLKNLFDEFKADGRDLNHEVVRRKLAEIIESRRANALSLQTWQKVLLQDGGENYLRRAKDAQIRFPNVEVDHDTSDPALQKIRFLAGSRISGPWFDLASMYVATKFDCKLVAASRANGTVKIEKNKDVFSLKKGLTNEMILNSEFSELVELESLV